MAKQKRTYDKPLAVDLDFDEALGRFAQTDPNEVSAAMADASEDKPLSLIQNAETGDRFVLYTKPDGQNLELRFEGEEPWATERQMAELFGVSQQNANYHINNIYKDGEMPDPETTYKEYLYVADNGQTYRPKAYNLDVVLAVGQRVKSKQGIMFRRWARQIERQYLLQGFVIDKPRLRDPKRSDHLDALLEEIAEIRASEANVWKRILELISKCADYHLMTDADRSAYFAAFQNAMHWAVAQMTAGEIVMDRLDASKPHAGLTSYPGMSEGKLPRIQDAGTAKNLYGLTKSSD